MQYKDFIVENGQMYYRKKPLYSQPLFWTTIVGAVLTFILGVAFLFTLIGLSVTEDSWSSTYPDSYFDGSLSYQDYRLGETMQSLDGVAVTVTAMGKDASVQLVDSYYSHAYVVDVELNNTSSTDVYIDESYFNLIDPTNQYVFPLDLRTYDVNVPEKIKPGEKLSLRLVYGVDEETNFALVFEDAMWTELVTEGI